MFNIGHQKVVPKSCPTGGCHTASGAVSGVYNSHREPHGGAYGVIGQQHPGEISLQPDSVLGVNPVSSYMIKQSVPHATSYGEVGTAPAMPQRSNLSGGIIANVDEVRAFLSRLTPAEFSVVERTRTTYNDGLFREECLVINNNKVCARTKNE